MKVLFKKEKLLDLVNKAFKGCTFNNNLPISKYLGIKIEDDEVEFKSLASSTSVSVKGKAEVENEAGVSESNVDAKVLKGLLDKTTTENIELELTDSSVILYGNGKYELPVRIEDDKIVKVGSITFNEEEAKKERINLKDLTNVINTNKVACDLEGKKPVLGGILFGDASISTDGFIAIKTNTKLLNTKVNIKLSTLDLFSIFDDDEVDIYLTNDLFKAKGKNAILIGALITQDYPNVSQLFTANTLSNEATVNIQNMLSALIRLGLTLSSVEKPAVSCSFKGDKLTLSTPNSKEVLTITSELEEEINYLFNLNYFITVLSTIKEETANFRFAENKEERINKPIIRFYTKKSSYVIVGVRENR